MTSTRSVHLLFLLLVLSLALCDEGFSQQGVPPGYQLLTDPQTSGGLLITQRQGVTAATALLLYGFTEIATFFDGRPRAVGGVQDAYDQQAEAGFQATIQRAPVAGVAIATIREGIGTVGFAFDSPQTIARTLPRLLQLVAGPGGGAAGNCAPPPAPDMWQTVGYPDGSGQLQLPSGWKVTGAHKGMVTAKGPHGAIYSALWETAVTSAGAAHMARLLPGFDPTANNTVAEPTDPIVVFRAKWEKNAAQMRRQGKPAMQLTRILEATPQPVAPGLSSVTLLVLEFEYERALYRGLAQLILGTVNMDGTYLYYESMGNTRTECFAPHLPTLVRILDSAQTAGHVLRERIQAAAQSLREARDIWWQTTQDRSRAQDRMNANWTEAFRGTRIVEDTRSGRWHDVDLAYSADTVRRLNEREGYPRYREIPLRDLNP
jgi:hypothetical protein